MKNQIPNVSLKRTVRTAGLAYLLIIIVPLLSMLFIDPKITVRDDAISTINNIITHEVLFRIDSIITFLMFVAVVVLAQALYKILVPVNKKLSQLALLWRFAEALVGMIAMLSSFILLPFIKNEGNLEKFGSDQFYGIAEMLHGFYWQATPFIFILLAIGSILVFYLFLKSRLIPKVLSVLGIISYSLVLVGALISLVIGGNAYMILGSQTMIFELVIGAWLLFKGINMDRWNQMKGN